MTKAEREDGYKPEKANQTTIVGGDYQWDSNSWLHIKGVFWAAANVLYK